MEETQQPRKRKARTHSLKPGFTRMTACGRLCGRADGHRLEVVPPGKEPSCYLCRRALA